jgi:hypothetical protein
MDCRPSDRIEFERCWPWLAASIYRYGNTHSKADVWSRIATGAHFWPLPHGAIVGVRQAHPSGMRQLNFWLAGGDLQEIAEMEPSLCAWASNRGCHRVVIPCGRRGWLKALDGYEESGIRLVKELTNAPL